MGMGAIPDLDRFEWMCCGYCTTSRNSTCYECSIAYISDYATNSNATKAYPRVVDILADFWSFLQLRSRCLGKGKASLQ